MSRKVFIIAFIAILALVCLVACKQEVTSNSNKLYGTWTGSFSIESYKFTVSDGTHFTLEESFEIWGHKETDTIKGTYQFTSDTEGTLTADVNDSLEFSRFFDDDGGDKLKTIPFSLDGDDLRITDPEQGVSVTLHRQ